MDWSTVKYFVPVKKEREGKRLGVSDMYGMRRLDYRISALLYTAKRKHVLYNLSLFIAQRTLYDY